LRGQHPRELITGVDAELLVDVAQVVLDGLRAQEQRGGGFPGGLPPGQQDGDLIFLLGETREELAGSEFLAFLSQPLSGKPPVVDLEHESRVQAALLECTGLDMLRSAHDVSDGGLLVTLAESVLFGSRGLRCPAVVGSVSAAALYFGESQARVVVSVTPRRVPELQQVMAHHQIPLQALGVVGGETFHVGPDIRIPLAVLRDAWETTF
jgi:phosphoribosylformylglycinamidine synthase